MTRRVRLIRARCPLKRSERGWAELPSNPLLATFAGWAYPCQLRMTNRRVSTLEELRSRKQKMHPEILRYNEQQEPHHKEVCDLLAQEIDRSLPEAEKKIWHAHPVWFLDGNPTVGYSKQKPGIRLMFWSGADFEEAELSVVGKKFKDASIFYNLASEVEKKSLRRWLKKAKEIQWNYKDLVRRKGAFERLK